MTSKRHLVALLNKCKKIIHINILAFECLLRKVEVSTERSMFSDTSPSVISLIYNLTAINFSLRKSTINIVLIWYFVFWLVLWLKIQPHQYMLSYNLSIMWRGWFLLRHGNFTFCNQIFLWEALQSWIWNDLNISAYFHFELYFRFSGLILNCGDAKVK